MIKLPGLIDVHVHLRDPEQTYKEDFFSGTTAAVFGGFTTILDMPNNAVPITTKKRLLKKINRAKKKAVGDIGFYFGSLGDHFGEFNKIKKTVFGLKLYLNFTTGNYLIDLKKLEEIMKYWPGSSPVLLHAESNVINKVIDIVAKTGKSTHICHISTKDELRQIIKAKEDGLPITCGVTPHHLFLNENDVIKLNGFAMMKPSLKSKKDQEFLWKNLTYIDVVESDHAPHTIKEKQVGNPAFGVPGLETTLPLLLTAVNGNKLTIEQIINLCYSNPKKIFKIPTAKNTFIKIDLKEKYRIENKNLKTKCGWSPFDGWNVKGRVKKVVIRGKTVLENNALLVKPGFGKVIFPNV